MSQFFAVIGLLSYVGMVAIPKDDDPAELRRLLAIGVIVCAGLALLSQAFEAQAS